MFVISIFRFKGYFQVFLRTKSFASIGSSSLPNDLPYPNPFFIQPHLFYLPLFELRMSDAKWNSFLRFVYTRVDKFLNIITFVMRCVIWCHLHNLKNVKNTHGGVLFLVNHKVHSLLVI